MLSVSKHLSCIFHFKLIQAACQRLRYGKVPSLCVLVKTFSSTETDSSIFLKDPTGDLYFAVYTVTYSTVSYYAVSTVYNMQIYDKFYEIKKTHSNVISHLQYQSYVS